MDLQSQVPSWVKNNSDRSIRGGRNVITERHLPHWFQADAAMFHHVPNRRLTAQGSLLRWQRRTSTTWPRIEPTSSVSQARRRRSAPPPRRLTSLS